MKIPKGNAGNVRNDRKSGGASAPVSSELHSHRKMYLLAAWTILALVNYLHAHPILAENFLSVTISPLLSLTVSGFFSPWLRVFAGASVVALQLVSCAGFGSVALGIFNLRRTAPGEKPFFYFLLGIGVFAILVQGIGFIGFYSSRSYLIVLAIGIALALPRFNRIPGVIRSIRARAEQPIPLWMKIGGAAAMLTSLAALLSGFTPLHISDELIYQAGYARWYLWNDKVVQWPNNFFSAFPQIATMHYGLPVSLGLENGIKWIHWSAGILASWGIYLSLRKLSRETRWTVIFLFMTIPAAWISAGRAFNDLFVCAFASGALVAAMGGRTNMRAALAGTMIGLAGGTKYTGALTAVTLIPFFSPRQLVIAGAAAAITYLPWMVRSWLWLSNPVYPYLYKLIGGFGWSDHLHWRYYKELLQGEPTVFDRLSGLPGQLWLLPIYNLGSWNDGSAGPLVGIALGFVFIFTRPLEWLAILCYFLPSAMGGLSLRYQIPIFPFILAIVARGMEPVLTAKKVGKYLVVGASLLAVHAMIELPPTGWKHYDDPLPYFFGQVSRARYLDHMLYPDMYYPYSYSRMLKAVDEKTPSNAKVLFIGGYGGTFYLPRKALFNPLQNNPLPVYMAKDAENPDRIMKQFRQMGITHVLVNRRASHIFFDYWKMFDWGTGRNLFMWREFWDQHAVKVWSFSDQFELVRISRNKVIQPHQRTPGFEEEVNKLLHTMLRKTKYAEAGELLNNALQLFPRNPGFWLNEADLLAHTGKRKDALTCCDNVDALAPRSMEADLCRAEIAIVDKRYAEAAVLKERALKRNSLDATQWGDLMGLYYVLGDKANQERCRVMFNLLKEYRPYQ